PDLALQKLTEAIDTVPEEPAALADRGLWYLRRFMTKEAAQDLQRAAQLAPDDPGILSLLGHLADQEGKFTDAVGLFRKALEKNPRDLLTLYALTEELDKEAPRTNDKERLRLFNEGLKIQPYNIRLLRDKALAAAQLKDGTSLMEAVTAYERLADSWEGSNANDARAQLQLLKKQAVEGPLPGDASTTITILDHCLQPEFGYVRDALTVDRKELHLGEPLEQFLRLAPMRATASPPDLALTFDPPSAPAKRLDAVAAGRWDVTLPVWLTQEADPTVFVANAKEVRAANAAEPVLPFPGGPKSVAPTAYGVLPVDWRNEFQTSFVLAGAGGLRFFQQSPDHHFVDVTAKTGLDDATLAGDYFGAWAADIDMDGDLDLIVARRTGPPLVLRNNGDGTFKVLKLFSDVDGLRAFAWADIDDDGAPDALLLDAQGDLHYYTNGRSGLFVKTGLPRGPQGKHEPEGKYLGLAAADLNNDGVMDVIALRDDGVVQRFSLKENSWEIIELARWADFPKDGEVGSYRILTADLDNNGGLDLIIAGPHGARIGVSDEQGKLSPLAVNIPERIFAVVDLIKDGRLDLLGLSESGQPVQRINQGKKNYHWQVIRPHGVDKRKTDVHPDEKINSFAIGGEIEIRSGLLVQKQLITSPVVHFGLGEQSKTAVARFIWPNGSFQGEYDLATDQSTQILQRLSSSCPFLFTWNGERVQFVTDILWSSPLGLYINAQDRGGIAQTTDWVKVRGDQLKPRDGLYDVHVTADLWETHYFDHVHLTVVDHPADTEIYADERFFLTPTPPQLYMTKPPRPVSRAVDEKGNDVTDMIRRIDGRYLNTFDLGKYQGVAQDHYVEVDLGDDAPMTGPVYLLATGWIQPTDSSINTAIEQGKNERPHGLVLEVADGKGGWTAGRPALGFPAGKNKTIVIRLDDIPGQKGVAPRRFRLRTNMEIYWDALEYAEGLDAGQARQTVLLPETAELRHRGISRITRADRSSPELPDYDKLVSRSQYWRDLIGWYTRYGDVRELLEKIDDRYVIMNAGDEIAMKFPAPDGPPPGWKRDFVWVSDGWTKDGNLNTRFSKTVLPLPYHDLKDYD
ncbi:MAG TPA: FG-GAP-like repeat-containing protein, partial [Gemmataceae bacterium]|nr:FG-GAP-like repeat-containing protein [Gemmataceae bacterium]